MRKAARILFDESHSQAWTIRPDVARAINPSHPEDSSYARAADAASARDFRVDVHEAGPLTAEVLSGADVLVVAHPSEARWERVVPGGPPRFGGDELDAMEAFVRGGGGLVLLAEEEQDKYGSNVAELAARFGIAIGNEVVSDYARHHTAPTWVLAELSEGGLLARVAEACFYRATTLGGGTALARASASASSPGAALLAVAEHGAGRVVVAGDSDLFGDDCLPELDHEALWLNLLYWAAGHAFAQPAPAKPSAAGDDPHWAALKHATDELRLLQEPDGSLPEPASALVDAMATAIEALRPRFPHQDDHIAAVIADLRAWDFGRPVFTRSLELFRPERDRRDGVEHLVVFPMYLQNASRDTRFEALIVRVPWPDWLAELERARYDNPKFVPVTFVDTTAGYDSECAVLFPETVSVRGRPVNHFG